MNYEVFCDEANPDVLTSAHPRATYLMIGSLWIRAELREELKQKIQNIRTTHNTWGEIKWSKVSPSRSDFYLDLVDLFVSYAKQLRFRCIAVDRRSINLELHNNDSELGFYKFYYQLLHHWIDNGNYAIFCDIKSNRDPKRLPVLAQCLARANPACTIVGVQSLPSHEVALIQLCDFLLGAASSRLNVLLTPGSTKELNRLEEALGHQLTPTFRTEEKFNVFKIRLTKGN